ncbi:hypothetical protein pdam_00013725, partial [Pocillopora damicornis]
MFLIRYFLRKTIYLVLLFLEENLRSKAKQVVDPDSHKIYSRRKEKQGTSSEPDTNSNESVHQYSFPALDGELHLKRWLQMNRHIFKSGKASPIWNTTPFRSDKRFLDDEYLEDIECVSDSRYFFFKGKCCHSFRKSDPPHNLKIAHVKVLPCGLVVSRECPILGATLNAQIFDFACINELETQTRRQAECSKWNEERKFRFTASQYHLISKRKRNHANFAEQLMNPTPVSSKYLEHGQKYEPVALMEYE